MSTEDYVSGLIANGCTELHLPPLSGYVAEESAPC